MAQLRQLPKVDQLARHPLLEAFSEPIRMRASRLAIQHMRNAMLQGEEVEIEQAPQLAWNQAKKCTESSLQRVINGSGVVLHTGLGRARLSKAAADAVYQVALHHSQVEFDLETGERGDRQTHVRAHLMEITGAADAHVVNNCAAAVFLALSALCSGKGVLLSRGQMVEIGGSFRMPDIVRQSGCRLVEVGCTNKTHLSDYANADDGDIGAILRCHPSNFKMVGFVEEPSIEALAGLCQEKGWVLIDDVGSGTLFDTSSFGLPRESTLAESIRAGADLVLSSADKMLGGPQAGLILGSPACVGAIRKHALARALRVDKLTLAALEATLRSWILDDWTAMPTFEYISRDQAKVKRDAQLIAKAYSGESVVATGLTEIGGGSVPGEGVATWRVGLKSASANALSQKLRTGEPALVGRIEKDYFWIDPRTMSAEDVKDTIRLVKSL